MSTITNTVTIRNSWGHIW